MAAMIATITTMVTTLKALGIDAPFIFQSIVTFLVLAMAFGVVFLIFAVWFYKKFKSIADTMIISINDMFAVQVRKTEEHWDKLVETIKTLPQEVQGTKKDMTRLQECVDNIQKEVHTINMRLNQPKDK